jgi:septal ring factor EnvC (AmiA/AmiB activator)
MGEQRGYSLDGEEFWRASSGGVRFGVSSRAPVQAANAGRISYTGELGYFGKTVVIDHGFGLTSLYAHLSEITGKVGDQVAAAQAIGRTGDSGFAIGEEVYFEIRMHGVPVSPNEWWDATWVSDHITKKIAFVQGTLIGNPGE